MGRRGIAAGVALAVASAALLAACDGGDGPEAEPTQIPVSAECRDAFEQVEGGGTTTTGRAASPTPDTPPGGVTSLYPTLEACDSVDEWSEALRAHPPVFAHPDEPMGTLRMLCRHARQDEFGGSDLCANIALDPS